MAHDCLKKRGIDHALIGGMALGARGVNRATADVDFMAEGKDKSAIKAALVSVGFVLAHETNEVLHFEGPGYLDVLLANRPLSQKMLANASVIPTVGMKCLASEDIIGLKIQAYINNPKREFQDKADILALVTKDPHLDWGKIKLYADLFDQWSELEKIRRKAES